MAPAPSLSPALRRLWDEVNALWPRRSRASDGWIGDVAHQTRPSDHNPDTVGMVHATDTTASGIDVPAFLAAVTRDPRTAYVIWNRRIWENPAVYPGRGYWRAYTGTNPHDKHVHVSVRRGAQWDRDASSWGLTAGVSNPTRPGGGSLPSITTSPILGIKEIDDMFSDTDRALLQNIENLLARGSASGGGIRGDVAAVRADIGTVANEARANAADLRQRIAQVPAPDVQALASALAPKLQALLTALSDGDVDRIRDAAVEANELTKGVISGGTTIRFSRVAQG